MTGMTNPIPVVTARAFTLSRGPAFVLSSIALVLVFASSGIPVPLYNLYRSADGVTDSALALTTVVYLAVTATTLLVFGRLSDAVGRRPMMLVALLSSAAGCLLLTQVHGVAVLIAGRALQGIACGLAASSLGSYIIETAPRSPAWLAPLVTGSAPTFGIPIGAVVSGVLVETAPAPRFLGFDTVAILLLVTAVALSRGPETMTVRGGVRAALRPRIELPAGARRAPLIVAVTAVFVATWSYSGFYQAFAPALTADYLGTSSSVAVALVFASIVILSPVGGSVSGRMRPQLAVRVGLVTFLVAVVGAVIALSAGSIFVFLGASLVVSLAMGATTTGMMRALLNDAPAGRRAGLLATVYLISYTGAAVPGLVASAFAARVDLVSIAFGYGVLVAVAVGTGIVASLLVTRRAR